ncbi:hypothetical protein DFH06DRAFT_185203 [Mycena polygramma]|nr:hypothetical protein DFH06DRAFT_185203 [Mycena polygramma]
MARNLSDMPRLPQELVDIIVDNIYEDENDIADLKSCSLAARAFVSSARRYIFRKIEILPPRSSCNPCQRFYQLITSSPHIAPLVEELCIVLVGSETSFAYNEDGEYLQNRHITWVMHGRTLSLVLPLLDLKRISLTENAPDWNGWGEFSMNWNKMGRKLKSALRDVFSSPKLEAVHLRGIVIESPRELLSLFSETSSLKELSLSRLYFTQRWDQRDAWPESQMWRPQLRSLLIAKLQSETFSRFMLNSRIDLTRVSSLTLSTGSKQWENKLVRAASGVEHLRLWYMQTELGEEIFSVNLRSIHLFSTVVLRLLRLFFEACPHDSRLEYITLEGHIGDPNTTDLDATVEWTVAHLRSLTTVEIKLRPESFHQWADDLRAALPSLERRSLLRVTETPWQLNGVHHDWE